MTRVTPCLWYDGNAEEAANLYASIFPDSSVDAVHRSPADYPNGKAGNVLTVEFTVLGMKFLGLNGGPMFKFDEAVSFIVHTKDQDETDRYWDAIVASGGKPSACGWITDRFGLSWQITPQRLLDMMASPDQAAAKRAMEAMMGMVKIDIATLERAFGGEERVDA
ncbi:MAG TPA: VOC family protein [Sphingomonas sp.]|nr:VOC family protein [Sphingomonas sp.]